MKLLCVFVLAAAFLTGCADSHQLMRQGEGSPAKLTSQDSVYIAISQDGIYGDENYPGSGKTTSQILLSAFSRHAQRVEVARAPQDYEESVKTARDRGFKFLVFPTILHWENHATEWNMVPDKVAVKVQLVGVSADRVLDSIIIEGKSGIATFGGDQPQDLLPKPVGQFVASLY